MIELFLFRNSLSDNFFLLFSFSTLSLALKNPSPVLCLRVFKPLRPKVLSSNAFWFKWNSTSFISTACCNHKRKPGLFFQMLSNVPTYSRPYLIADLKDGLSNFPSKQSNTRIRRWTFTAHSQNWDLPQITASRKEWNCKSWLWPRHSPR